METGEGGGGGERRVVSSFGTWEIPVNQKIVK